jgi:hypothetical protein
VSYHSRFQGRAITGAPQGFDGNRLLSRFSENSELGFGHGYALTFQVLVSNGRDAAVT